MKPKRDLSVLFLLEDSSQASTTFLMGSIRHGYKMFRNFVIHYYGS